MIVLKIVRNSLILFLLAMTVGFSCKEDSALADTPDSSQQIKGSLPDTGQTSSYTTTKGEDSDFLIYPPSYTDLGNGTVTDNITGLMWQKVDGGEMTFENSASYSKNLTLGGFSDWRLPTSHELFCLNNFDKVNPALDVTYFSKTAAEYWWTTDLRADLSTNVWVVNAGGGIGAHPKAETISAGGTKRFHVRAVRNPTLATLQVVHFVDNGNGTITDNFTGLIWQKVASGNTFSWEEALVFATGLSLAGANDWRVPNIKELQSLNDEKLLNPSFNKLFFSTIVSGNYWSSTSMVNAPTRAWDINTEYGIVSYNEKTVKEYLLCVRGGR
ncbi:MAG: DUF1566 domain-containing protein [Prolixibacteraceae bacterium]